MSFNLNSSLSLSGLLAALRVQGRENLSWMLILAAIFIACVFAMGGSSRSEVASLQVLRPLSIVALGLALMSLRLAHIRNFAVPLALAIAAVLLAALQLIPLPPGVAGSLAGRGLLAEVDVLAGLGPVWRPMAMSEAATLNALGALLVPLSMFLIGIQLAARDQARLLVVILAAGGVTALIALMQTIGDPQGSLYLYDTTNFGSAVGLFANRNHQAALLACLIPLMFAAVRLHAAGAGPAKPTARKLAPRMIAAIAATAFIVPLMLITGSRSGLLMGIAALASLIILLPRASKPAGDGKLWASRRFQLWAGAAGLVALTLLAVWLQRALAIDRLLDRDRAEDMRTLILPTMFDMIWLHQPWGVGFGAFKEVYKVSEPAHLLMAPHMNQSHNDWLDLALTGGALAITAAAAALGTGLWRTAKIFNGNPPDQYDAIRKGALIVLLILAGASLSDYPLRTPAMACLFALAAVWAAMPFAPSATEGSHATGSLNRLDLDRQGN
ncbi:MAG: hypothetical protein CFE36_09680 [Sphingomonadaceae bacterium PASS1]|nr:MAG: hypothetical protein CFE36_09680 [Sphingomonadaceae bacterium PASS1]